MTEPDVTAKAASPPATAPGTARFQSRPPTRGMRVAAGLGLFGILVTLIHLVFPSPLMFTIFMLFGQSAFALAMGVYAWVILRDLRHRKAL